MENNGQNVSHGEVAVDFILQSVVATAIAAVDHSQSFE